MTTKNSKNWEIFRLPNQVIFSALVIFLMGSFITFLLSDVWSTREDYSFGYLMPLFCLFIIYDRKEKIFSFFEKNYENAKSSLLLNLFFGAMLFFGVITFILSSLTFLLYQGGIVFSATWGFCCTFFAMVYFASKQNKLGQNVPISDRLKFTSLFLFPAFAWMISAPMFSFVESMISTYLLSKVAAIVLFIMSSLGYIVELRGSTIVFPNGVVGVADACSGIRSLTACLFAGTFLGAAFLDKFWKKILMVLLAMCFAFFNNLLRALFLSFWAYNNGSDSIEGFVHDAAGYFVLGLTVLDLVILLPLFSLSATPKNIIEEEEIEEETHTE